METATFVASRGFRGNVPKRVLWTFFLKGGRAVLEKVLAWTGTVVTHTYSTLVYWRVCAPPEPRHPFWSNLGKHCPGGTGNIWKSYHLYYCLGTEAVQIEPHGCPNPSMSPFTSVRCRGFVLRAF